MPSLIVRLLSHASIDIDMRTMQRIRPSSAKKVRPRVKKVKKEAKEETVVIKKEVKKEKTEKATKKKAAPVKMQQAAAAAAVPPPPSAQQKAAKMGGCSRGLVRTKTGGRKPPGGTFTKLLLRVQLAKLRGKRTSARHVLETWEHLAAPSEDHRVTLLTPGIKRSLYNAQDAPKRPQMLRINTGPAGAGSSPASALMR